MSEAPSARRYPRWARVLGWLCMVVMGVACLGFIGFRLLVWQVRNKVEGVIAGAVTPEVLSRNSTPSATTHASPAQTGLAATAIPHLGPVFSGDETANLAFATTVETLRSFLNNCGKIPEEGPIDFQALLISLGVDLPAGTTNAEAAALFLGRASVGHRGWVQGKLRVAGVGAASMLGAHEQLLDSSVVRGSGRRFPRPDNGGA